MEPTRRVVLVGAVIFDVDGTLVDSVDLHARAWHEAFADFGVPVSYAAVRAQIGKGGDQLMPVFVTPDRLAVIGQALEEHRAKLFKRRYLPEVRGFPRVRELFQRLREDRVRVALASSAKGDELGHYQRVAGIDGLVDHATSADDVERSKPHPDVFVAALDGLGRPDTAACLAVGDSPFDALAAGKAQLHTVGVRCGGFPDEVLAAAGCERLYDAPAALLEHYEQAFARVGV